MDSSYIIAPVSFLIIVLLGLLFLFLALKGWRDDLLVFWAVILDKLRIRNDMLPSLIETVRKYTRDQEKDFDEMISLRTKSWPVWEPNAEKVQIELRLTECLHRVWDGAEKVKALKLDSNFLALQKDFSDIGKEIDEMTEEYNKKIRSFNRRIGFVFLKPVAARMGFKRMPIFEFEP